MFWKQYDTILSSIVGVSSFMAIIQDWLPLILSFPIAITLIVLQIHKTKSAKAERKKNEAERDAALADIAASKAQEDYYKSKTKPK
jgi:branched-subunit amino acid permease